MWETCHHTCYHGISHHFKTCCILHGTMTPCHHIIQDLLYLARYHDPLPSYYSRPAVSYTIPWPPAIISFNTCCILHDTMTPCHHIIQDLLYLTRYHDPLPSYHSGPAVSYTIPWPPAIISFKTCCILHHTAMSHISMYTSPHIHPMYTYTYTYDTYTHTYVYTYTYTYT